MWLDAERNFFEYNKSIITLASSALVLSFTAAKISNLHTNLITLAISWVGFIITIFFGLSIQLMNFLYSLAESNIHKLSEDKVFKSENLKNPEVGFYWEARIVMFWISIFEMFLFILSLVFLMISAFLTISY